MKTAISEEVVAVVGAIAISAAAVGYAVWPESTPSPRVALAAQTLPGMVVEMPGAPIINGSFESGMAYIDRDGRVTAVLWAPGESLDDAAVAPHVEDFRVVQEKIEKTAVTAGPLRDVTVGDAPGRAVTLTADRKRFEMTYVVCAGRRITIATEETAGEPPLHAAIRDSFACRPELREVAMTPELAVDRRDGWYVVPAGDLRAWTTGAGSAVMVRVVGVKEGAAEEQAFVERAVENSGADMALGPRQERPVAGGTRPLWTATGDERDIALSVWTCDSGHRVLGVASTRHGEDLAPAIDLLLTARCLKPGEAAPEYPSPP